MLWRPRALLAPFVVVVLLAAGTSATGAAPVATAPTPAAPVTTDADDCRVVPLSAVGRTPRLSEPGGGSWRTECWTVTPAVDGAHALRFVAQDHYLDHRWTMADPSGRVVSEGSSRRQGPLVTALLEAGATYRIEVSRPAEYTDVSPYRLAVHDLSAGCAPLPAPSWSGDGATVDVTDDRLACGERRTTAAAPLRLRVDGTYAGTALAVVDQTGTARCTDRLRSDDGVVRCGTLPAGTYRVLVAAAGTITRPVELSAVPLDTDDGCTPMPLATYGAALPVAARRAADGEGQECYAVTAGVTGPHDLHVWQVSPQEVWRTDHEVWDVTAGELVAATSDWQDIAGQRDDQPVAVGLRAGHEYRVLVGGRPFSDLGDRLAPHDPRYRLGVQDRSATEGCDPVRTGWQDPATSRELRDAGTDCVLIDAPAGQWSRIDLRHTEAVPGQARVQGRVLDGDGDVVRGDGRVCRYVADAPEPDLAGGESACPLDGPGPYRLVTNTSWGTTDAGYTVRATTVTDRTGCRALPWATWGEPLPVSRRLDPTGTDCWTVELPADSQHSISLAEDGPAWASSAVEVYSAADGHPRGSLFEPPAGTYRVVVAGRPGAASPDYRLGVFDLQGAASDGPDLDVSCPVMASTSLAAPPTTGRTARGGMDCHRVPDGVEGPVLTRIAPGEPGATRVGASVRGGPWGWTECGFWYPVETRCDLEPGAYRVLVSSHLGENDSPPYALTLTRPTDREGCRPPRAAAPDADLLVADLPAGGPSACVALDGAKDRLLWAVEAADDVRAVVLDGGGEVACEYEPGTGGPDMCLLRSEDWTHPAPYSVVLTNTGTTDRRARLLLRSDPTAERGCTPGSWSDGNGPLALTGRTDGPLDVECHSLELTDGGVLLNRRHLDGGAPPPVLVFGPDGGEVCGGWGVDPVQTLPECWPRHGAGRYVFWVLDRPESTGRYRVDLGCDNLRMGCAQAPPVDFTRATLRGPVAVGRTLRAGVRGVPPRGQVSWRWYVGDRVVRRAKAYTPARADRGKRLRVQAVVTAPRYPKRTLRSAARTVRPR